MARQSASETKTRTTRKKVSAAVQAAFNPYAALDKEIDKIERDEGLTSTGTDPTEDRMSTSMLVLDLMLGGGVTGGAWITNFGPEQSSKSTGAIATLAGGILSNVPLIFYYDYEGSGAVDYTERIMQMQGVQMDYTDLFGVTDNKGVIVKRGRIRKYEEAVAEKFFNSVSRLLRSLPDKKRIGDQWYFIYEDTKANRAIVGSHFDKSYHQKTKLLRVPAADSAPQAVILLDSYPAMLPEDMDKDEVNNGMAQQARMFSEQIKRVKGRLRRKRVSIIGINQVRQRPAARFSNPEYEPGGDALKFYSDIRLRYNSRSLSGVPFTKGTGQLEEEPSIFGKGNDTYRYIHVRAHKNKLSTPGLEGWLRIWVKDRKGRAWGYCPVWDTLMYLTSTGQMVTDSGSSRKKLYLRLKRLHSKTGEVVDVPCDGVALSWMDFKRWVLGSDDDVREICEKVGLPKPIRIRTYCFKQMRQRLEDGTILGIHLYFSHTYADDKPEPGEEDGDPSDGDENESDAD